MAKQEDSLPPNARTVAIGAGGRSSEWQIPEEVPVAFVYNRRNYAVMLATPDNLKDFAVGFSLSERIVQSLDQIKDIYVKTSSQGAELHITIAEDRLERLDIIQRRRNMVGRAGCGLCGLENAESFFETLPPVADQPLALAPELLKTAADRFFQHQPLNQQTRTVHGAGFVSLTSGIVNIREDIGRHNALDKLLGACAHDQTDMTEGFVLMSSRCSYEIVEKSARLGVRAIASLSAPTAFAVRKAAEARISLYCRSGDQFVHIRHTETE